MIDLVAERTALAGLARFLDDPDVTEVMVNGGSEVWVERQHRMSRAGSISTAALMGAVEQILAPLGRRVDRLSPIVDARLADGSRLCVAIPPVAVDGPCVSIRRFADRTLRLDDFADPSVVEVVASLVSRRCNLVVSGATSTGKTSLLNALCGLIPDSERVITMEDTAELRLDHAHVVRLETRGATAEGVGRVTMADLLRLALRMRPDRLVLGEARGPEVLELLQAMNTGHDGSMATIHANSAADALGRVCALVLTAAPAWPPAVVGELAGSAIDVMLHLGRSADGARRVIEVVELGAGGGVERVLVRDGVAVGVAQRGRR